MVFSKKGQGMSLNVIIVAALALIVLVVLIVVFTGRVQIFKEGVSKEGSQELAGLKIYYGKCHPSGSFEEKFLTEFERAELPEEQDLAKADFKREIDRCKDFSESLDVCQSESGCTWS